MLTQVDYNVLEQVSELVINVLLISVYSSTFFSWFYIGKDFVQWPNLSSSINCHWQEIQY